MGIRYGDNNNVDTITNNILYTYIIRIMLCSRYGVDLVSIWCRYDTITVLYYTTGALDTPPVSKNNAYLSRPGFLKVRRGGAPNRTEKAPYRTGTNGAPARQLGAGTGAGTPIKV